MPTNYPQPEGPPVDPLGSYADTEDPLKCGYVVVDSVTWPSVSPDDLKKPESYTDYRQYPASANLDGFREDQESPAHEASESKSVERDEHR